MTRKIHLPVGPLPRMSDEEAVYVVNSHGNALRGGNVLVDASLNPLGTELTVIANSVEAAAGSTSGVSHAVGSTFPVKRRADGTAYVEIRDLPPSEAVVLVNHP